MLSSPADLMEKYYSSEHGTVDVRSVLGELRARGENPAAAFITMIDEPAQSRWRLSAVEGMRALVASGDCGADEASKLLSVTGSLSAEQGWDEYIKTINAIISCERAAPLLVEFIRERLSKSTPSENDRWLIFYAVGVIAQRKTVRIPESLRNSLAASAMAEPTEDRRRTFLKLLESLN